jgi:hypothetical protein
VPDDALDGRPQADRPTERFGQRQRQALVAAGDARRRLVVDVRYAGEVAGGHQVGGVAARDLHPREERLTRARGDLKTIEEAPGAQIPCAPPELSFRRGGGRLHLRQARAGSAARLPAPVAHALIPEAEPEALGELAHGGVAGQDELRAHLHHRAVLETARPHPTAHALAGLEHHHLRAAAMKLVGRAQPGEPGADHRDLHCVRPAATASTAIAPR